MKKGKKFGTFSGVFVPSILTILGVIMYLRLPWIVGQAGLYTTLAIILVAHLISISTGLSISSIATDKKVQAGGNYYIVSRSLGLPIGGTLGIALFIGLSFSVSLYIIGFSESFLGFWGLEVTKNSIRLTGTLAVIIITTITFISTSLALKTQYFILSAIGLSLISILMGRSDLAPAQPFLMPPASGVSVMVLFGIFFPAVTGFEAGVSMSGDLRDPKKSIPGGTLSAILVGLLVYVGLAAFFSIRVRSDALINNPNILLDMSFFWPLVIAGIWGATISSAMGSILSAPRILQATSIDRITPRIFAKGFGSLNEPRNALLLTFVIAEIGILIGELNVIARVVSIFFVTTYGFLNLSCAIENWASTDFRPAFRIPTWVSIIGAVACFVVMLELDFIALIGAVIIMGGIFLLLTRKQLTLESGDTWEGVWSSVIRSGLNRLTRGVSHRRNWRPNIILFSGGSGARPHLIELGKRFIHKRGMMSNFHLHENPDSSLLFSKNEQILKHEDDSPGLFSRKMECRDIYEGIETIARIYGFSGIDPNTVMMGWARKGEKPEHYARLLQQLISLDYNLILLNYDEARGFGGRKYIDIWWRGASNNVSLSLMLFKFLSASEDWMQSEARLFIISDESERINKFYNNALKILAEQRIEAHVKVINNSIENLPIADIIKSESENADLIMLGIPEIQPKAGARYMGDINELINDLGTVLLVSASSYFETPYIGLESSDAKQASLVATEAKVMRDKLPDLVFPPQSSLATPLQKLHSLAENVLEEYGTGFLKAIHKLNTDFIEELQSLTLKNFNSLKEYPIEEDVPRFRRYLARYQSDMFFQSWNLFKEYRNKKIPQQINDLEQGIGFIMSKLGAILEEFPKQVSVYYDPEYAEPRAGDSLRLRVLKLRKRLRRRFSGKPVPSRVTFHYLAKYIVSVQLRNAVFEQLKSLGTSSYRFISDLQKWFDVSHDSLIQLEKQLEQKALSVKVIETKEQELLKRLQEIGNLQTAKATEMQYELLCHSRNSMGQIFATLGGLEAAHRIQKYKRAAKAANDLLQTIVGVPALWNKNLILMTNFSQLNLTLMMFVNRLDTIMERQSGNVLLSIDNNALSVLNELRKALETFAKEPSGNSKTAFRWAFDERSLFDGNSVGEGLLADLQDATKDLPDTVEIISQESFQQIEAQPFEEVEVVSVALKRLVDYMLETELVNPIRERAEKAASQLEDSRNTVHDITRLICYVSSGEEAGEEATTADTVETLPDMIQNALKHFGEEEERIRKIRNDISDAFLKNWAAVFEKMNPRILVGSARNLGRYMRTRESHRVRSTVEIESRRIKDFLRNFIVGIWYRRSEGVLFAKKLRENQFTRPVQTDTLLNLVESVSPSSAVLGSVPHFYKQLFLGRQSISPEFWVRRQNEMAHAEKALARFRRGLRGAVMVVGEPHSGKTSLCRMIALKTFDRNRIYRIYAPDGGSINPGVFYRQLSQELKSSGNREDILGNVPQGSAIIINDLELWWERSPGGFAVVDEIIRLILRYSDRYLFILNANTHGFRLINTIRSIEDLFLAVIECDPLDAEDIQKAIMLRHESTGLQFELNGLPEDRISEIGYAKLFTRFFDYCAGNVGIALHAWISHIERVEKDRLTLRMPQRPDLHILKQMESDRVLWLLQFIVHKRLTSTRLCRVFRKQENEIQKQLRILLRSGLIVERSPDVFEINPFLVSFVIETFTRQKVL